MEKSNSVQFSADEQAALRYTYNFVSSKPAEEIFKILLNVEKWWSGLYAEAITGSSSQVDDVFSFNAGGGAHYSEQKLVELIPGKRVAWLVVNSNLSFLEDPKEWNNTKISFDLLEEGDTTIITFTHQGLSPQLECYDSCSNAWTAYLEKLKRALLHI